MRKGIPSFAARRRNRKRPKSSIEKLVAAWLLADGISFKTEVKVGKCHIDVVIGKKGAVELNGCYYHFHPKCYPNQTRKMIMKRIRDRNRMNFLIRKGFNTYVFWECEILGQPDVVREQLRQIAKKECPEIYNS